MGGYHGYYREVRLEIEGIEHMLVMYCEGCLGEMVI